MPPFIEKIANDVVEQADLLCKALIAALFIAGLVIVALWRRITMLTRDNNRLADTLGKVTIALVNRGRK